MSQSVYLPPQHVFRTSAQHQQDSTKTRTISFRALPTNNSMAVAIPRTYHQFESNRTPFFLVCLSVTVTCLESVPTNSKNRQKQDQYHSGHYLLTTSWPQSIPRTCHQLPSHRTPFYLSVSIDHGNMSMNQCLTTAKINKNKISINPGTTYV